MNDEKNELRQRYFGEVMKGLLSNLGGPIQASELSGWKVTNCNIDDVIRFALDVADRMVAALYGWD